MNCKICNDEGWLLDRNPIVPCPAGCAVLVTLEFTRKRLVAGESEDDILGLKPAGQSIVKPGSDHIGRPQYDGAQS